MPQRRPPPHGAPSRGALAALMAGEADIAIIGRTTTDELPASLSLQPLTRYPIHLLCPADHVFAAAKKLTVQ